VRIEEVERYVHVGMAADARRKVAIAVREGKLTREPCGLCMSQHHVQAHHRDYSKPLEVVWICRRCHPIVTKIETMLKQCAKAVEIALEDENLRPIAEVFAQELTDRAHHNRQWKPIFDPQLARFVERCLTLFLRCSVSKTASKPRWRKYPWLKKAV
jgi:hypothetical protein